MINEILSSLSALPHRYSTSSNEHRASKYLAEKLAELKIEVERAPFVAPTTYSWIYVILYMGFVLGVAIGFSHPWPGLFFVLASAVLFVGEQTTRYCPLERWVPGGLSHNLIGHIPAREKNGNTLILVAHYDTSKTSLTFHPRLVAGLRRAYLLSLLMIALIILGSIAAAVAPAATARIISEVMFAPAAYILFTALALVEREIRGQPVNGAADNASGVAVVMELAKRIKEQNGLRHWKVIVLLTGSEEVGMAGMSRFLAQNEKTLDRRRTVFLNFDNIGAGQLAYITREGMLYSLPADPAMIAIAQDLAASDPRFASVTGRPFTALTLDTLVPRARGYPVLSFMGLNEQGIPQPWHWHNDTLENLDRNLVQFAAEFGWEFVKRLEG